MSKLIRSDLPIVVIDRVRCPYCGSTRVKTTRSVASTDGSSTRTTICLAAKCGKRFLVILA